MRIRTVYILVLTLLVQVNLKAQNQYASIQLPSRYIENYWVVPDNDGNTCIQYYYKKNMHFVIVDDKGNKVKEIRHPFRYQPEFFAGHFSNGTYQFYYEPRSRKKEGDVGAFFINPGSSELEKQARFDLKASNMEEFAGHFRGEDKIYLLISARSSNVLRVVALDGSDNPDITTYTAPQSLEKAFRNSEPFLMVNPLAFKSIYNYQANKKIYYNDGQLYFTIDSREQFKTHIWKVNLKDKTSELISFPGKKLVFGKASNSYLHEDRLFRFTVDQVKIDLSIYALNGKDSVKSFNHTGEGTIAFKTGPIRFIDEYGTQQSIADMKNDKLFKTFSNGNPSVFVENVNKNNVKVTMGAFNEMASGLSIGGGFGSIGRSGGIAIGGSKQLTGTRRGSTFFHSYLNVPQLTVSEDDDLLTLNERIFRYLDKNRRNVYSSKVYTYNQGTVHLAFVDPNEAKLTIVEFAR